MPPADSASRAGGMPKASRDRSLGTFGKNMNSVSMPLLKLALIGIPLWSFTILLWSGMGRSIIRADQWWIIPLIILILLGLCVPSALTAVYIWRKRFFYSSIASRAAVFLLLTTSVGIFTYIGYVAESGFMGGWELILWIGVCMIQLLIYAGLVHVCDRETWNK